MRISTLIGREVGLLGFGLEGQATLAALRRHGHMREVSVLSDAALEVPEGARSCVGDAALAVLPRLEVLVRSPGFAPHHALRAAADARALTQTTATDLFLSELRAQQLPVIGITGSKGKSTTSTLTQLTLDAAGVTSVLAGNIGRPALEQLERIINERLVTVIELSSYQCSDLRDEHGPSIAGLLDLFPEHLDWHGSVDAYYAAKLRIAFCQRTGDTLRYNAASGWALTKYAGSHRLQSSPRAVNTPTQLHFADGWFMRGGERFLSDNGMLLPGEHNRQNAVMAFALAEQLGAQPTHLQHVLTTFAGLPYRLQDEGERRGIRFVNDSLSTAPEVAATALRALGAAVTTLIAGGFDRGLDQAPLVEALRHSSVHTLIVLPDTGAAIARGVRAAQLGLQVLEAGSLEAAVTLAAEHTQAGATCLFSPGAPSYNVFKSFEERGKHFRALIAAL